MQTRMTETLTQEPNEDTAYLITDAGMEALRLAEAPDSEPFTPDTPEKADWVLKQIARHRTDAARVRENMELMARESEREAERLEWQFGAALQAFARRETQNGRKKSVRLPNGVLGFRTKPAGLAVSDDAAALAWTRENLPDALRVDKRALADALLTTGEVVPFAAFTPAEEVFYVK